MTETPAAAPAAGTVAPDGRRWKALVFIAVAQLMVSVDSTIVNIALPSAQRALGISDSNRQWVVTAYMLAFGGLLLLGGRIADSIGRRRAFLIGVIGFGLASALGGVSVDTGMLLTARALQGAFGALLAPAGLSLLAVTFTEPSERAKAFGVFSAIAGSGSAVGLILGGVLTEYINWRWSLFVNVAFAAVVVAGAVAVVRDEEDAVRGEAVVRDGGGAGAAGGQGRRRLDTGGALLSVAGVVSLVYAFSLADTDGWTAPLTLVLFAACVVLLTLFVVVEKRNAAPLLPLRIVTERNRAGVFASQALAVITMFGLLLFLTYYFQNVRGYTPLLTGVAFLPMVAGMLIGAGQFASRMMPRMAPRWIMGPGFGVAALGMLLLTQLNVDSSYPLPGPPRPTALRYRPRARLHPGDEPGHPWSRPRRDGRGLRDDQRLPAVGRFDRHGAAQHDRGQHDRRLAGLAQRDRRPEEPGSGARLRRRGVVDRRHPGPGRPDDPPHRQPAEAGAGQGRSRPGGHGGGGRGGAHVGRGRAPGWRGTSVRRARTHPARRPARRTLR